MLRTRQIAEELNQPCQGVRLWWLGGSGFAVRAGEALILVDPVLSLQQGSQWVSELGRELIYEPPVLATEIEEVDLILVTRAGGSDLGPETLRELRRTKATYVCPRRGASTLASLGIESVQLELAEPGKEMQRAGVKVTATEARLGRAEDGCGYLLEMGGKRIFHPGDTVVLDEMLGIGGVEVLVAPIGAGPMGIEGAARLANALGSRWVLPCDYWTYTDDETWGALDPRLLIEYVEDGEKRVRILNQGEMFEVGE